MTESILSYQQEDSVKLLCEIDLKKRLPAPKQREQFNKKCECDQTFILWFLRRNEILIPVDPVTDRKSSTVAKRSKSCTRRSR